MFTIRPETATDIPAVRALNESAFRDAAEARIVDALRSACPDVISLVASEADQVLGHLFFSPVVITGGSPAPRGMGLAPMAVLPGRQRQGIGSMLVRAGVTALRERGCPFIIVVGHPQFYPRFGFVPATRYGLSCQWSEVPDEAFMILVLDQAAMKGVSGTARYHDIFGNAM